MYRNRLHQDGKQRTISRRRRVTCLRDLHYWAWLTCDCSIWPENWPEKSAISLKLNQTAQYNLPEHKNDQDETNGPLAIPQHLHFIYKTFATPGSRLRCLYVTSTVWNHEHMRNFSDLRRRGRGQKCKKCTKWLADTNHHTAYSIFEQYWKAFPTCTCEITGLYQRISSILLIGLLYYYYYYYYYIIIIKICRARLFEGRLTVKFF